jgi:hypothetical protein
MRILSSARIAAERGSAAPLHSRRELDVLARRALDRACSDAINPELASRLGSLRSDLPPTRTVPVVGLRRPAITRSSVVFPAPFGPNSARQSPAPSERSTASTARRRPKVRLTPETSTAGGVGGAGMRQT